MGRRKQMAMIIPIINGINKGSKYLIPIYTKANKTAKYTTLIIKAFFVFKFIIYHASLGLF
jgi:hypothetical protein